jgi:hypothetical protein
MNPLRLNKGSTDRTKRDMVDFVNSHFPEFDEPAVSVREILDNYDIVFGLWQHPSEPDGVGMCVIKGKNLLREIVASKEGVKVQIAAVPCESGAHARAAEQVFGDPVN